MTMNLNALIHGHASPGLIHGQLMQRFDAVDTVEATRDGRFDMRCIAGDRVRLVLRYQHRLPFGWTYCVLPQRRRPRRPYRSGDVTYRPDGSWTIAP